MFRGSKMTKKTKETLVACFYILPSFLLILTFSVIPIVMSGYFSFTEYNILNPPEWVGIENYIKIWKDTYMKSSLLNTFIYTVFTVPIQTIISMVFAAFIASKLKNKYGMFLRSAMFIPVIASAVTAGTVWRLILATDGGILNSVLGFLQIPPINWLGSKSTALLSVGIVAIWKNVGYFLVIFYAGIMGIPRDLYEAAEVDGATKVYQFTKITLPMLKPITYFVVTLGMIWSFQVFDIVYVMTGGGPGRATTTLVMTIYNAAFKDYKMGYASAIAMLLLGCVLIINFIQGKFFKEKEDA